MKRIFYTIPLVFGLLAGGCSNPDPLGDLVQGDAVGIQCSVSQDEKGDVYAQVSQNGMAEGNITETGILWLLNSYTFDSDKANRLIFSGGNLSRYAVELDVWDQIEEFDYKFKVAIRAYYIIGGVTFYSETFWSDFLDREAYGPEVTLLGVETEVAGVNCTARVVSEKEITERGFRVDDYRNGSRTDFPCGSGSGEFSAVLSGLPAGKELAIYAYAKNKYGKNRSEIKKITLSASNAGPR